MVDKVLLLRKLASLAEYRGQLAEYSVLGVEQYRSDWKIQRIVERTLQMMIETCADVAGHVISDGAFRTPDTYADTSTFQRGDCSIPFLVMMNQVIYQPKEFFIHA